MVHSIMGRSATVCALVVIALVTAEARAQAYIDPGSTGLFLQGLIGGLAAFIVLTRTWWRRLLSRVRNPGQDGPPHNTDE